ncbi:MAG TPA: ATPase, T2SS/T4P/T4SS family [Gemmatimonadaceae bacterium]|nr:ATPase, T2SS/T4P/T4SS family [Gemmatimonadaceae bacterium]
MIAARPGATGDHWCVRIARQAGWPNADRLTVPAGATAAEAWAAVTTGCGVTEANLAHEIARSYRLQVVHWETVESQAAKLVPERFSRKHHVFPVREDYRSIYIATADPNDLLAEQEVALASGRTPVMMIASPSSIATSIEAGYGSDTAATASLPSPSDDLENAVRAAERKIPEAVRAEELSAAPIISLANLVLRDAVEARAGDIHMEPGRQHGTVRFRVDGVMREHLQLPMSVFNRVVSRIKLMAGLDISDRVRPQDGRTRISLPDGRSVNLRLSTVPSRDSEKAVVRILDSTSARKLHEGGILAPELRRIERLIACRDGIVLVTGPTGSGKTTTVYGAIHELADGQLKITTIEDPIESEVGGITQIQVETRRGETFVSTLQSALRDGPDIVFVGEIRDMETAQTAANAALTGHLVLSTMDTSDAIGVISRLGDLGLDRATIATSLRGAVAQRLVRRLCTHCSVPVADPLTPDEERLSRITTVRPVQRAVGCNECGGTGYVGRVAIAEVLVVTRKMESLIAGGEPMPGLLKHARSEGMRLLSTCAVHAVRKGLTSLEEVERVIGLGDFSSFAARERVLVVDDDPVVRTVACALLAKDGFDVTEADSGEAALEHIRQAPPFDLMILDLGLPSISGRGVLKSVRAGQATRRLPVVILTGNEDASLESDLIDEGADDYLRKPVDPARFMARVKAVLRRAHGRG